MNPCRLELTHKEESSFSKTLFLLSVREAYSSFVRMFLGSLSTIISIGISIKWLRITKVGFTDFSLYSPLSKL